MEAPLFLYRVSFSNGQTVIIAAVNLQAALDCAKGELLKVTDATGHKSLKRSTCIGIEQIERDIYFFVAPNPVASDQSDDDEPSLAQKIEWAADARMYLGGK